MNRLGLASAGALVLSLTTVPLACGGDAFSVGPGAGDDGGGTGDGPRVDGVSGDDGSHGGDDGSPGEGGPSDGPPPADAPHEAPPPGSVVYVSATTGNDGNDGIDPSKPKKTIASALTRAQSIQNGPEVHVCKGVYLETGLSLSVTLQLLGGFDCSTWKRTATYGFPTYDGVNQTTIQNADPSAQPSTLLVTGGVAPSATIDGFTIQGATTQGATSAAVQTQGSASPVLQNDILAGGGGIGASGKPGSIGLVIGGGSPELRFSVVTGGSGTGSIGSTGIAVNTSGTPYVHDAIVSGGTGTAASPNTDTSAVGIFVGSSMSQANALKNLVVVGSDDTGTSGGSTVGISVIGSAINVDIESSAIRGGTGAGGSTLSVGVSVTDSGGTVRVLGDRIYGGTRQGGASTYGVFVAAAGSLNVHNSEIHAGSTSGTATGVVIVSGSSASVVDDIIYTGAGPGFAVVVDSGVKGVALTDDLLLGSNNNSQAAVNLVGCSGSQLSSLDHTAFVNFGTLYACGATTANTVVTMAAQLPGTPTAGDVEIGSGGACSTPSTCVPDPSCPGAPTTCIPSVLGASWTPNDDGVTGLFNGAPASAGDAGSPAHGWTLPPGSLCAIARGGAPYAGITQDIFGNPRSPSKPTIGAVEYLLSTCN